MTKPMEHFLSLADLSPDQFWELVDKAAEIKAQPSRYMKALYEKTLLMIFQAPSLRTRLSFETAMTQLHGHAINYNTEHSPWGAGKETVEDMARVISRYCHAVCARIYEHEELKRFAEFATVPVINAMTNYGHPCQIIGDFLSIDEKLHRRQGLRIAYLGDACNNVTYSLMRAAILTGGVLVAGCPEGSEFRPDQDIRDELEAMAARLPGSFELVADPREAARDADVVYADSWMSYRIPAEAKARRHSALSPYQVTEELMTLCKDDALFMHCLPAQRNYEVTDAVIDGKHSIVFDQAENRLHSEKAILLELIG